MLSFVPFAHIIRRRTNGVNSYPLLLHYGCVATKNDCHRSPFRLHCGVSQPRQIHNLALIGFMGTGKSSVGRLVAAQLRFDFIDTDHLIESRTGKRISDIFAQAGETGFREIENEVVSELARLRHTVIATGGGLAANPAHLAALKDHALVVCLWAAPEVVWERVRGQTHRPLLQGPDAMAKICELLAARGPIYRQADILIGTGMRSIKEVAFQVRHQFEEARHRAQS